MYWDDDFGNPDDVAERPRDSKIDRAKEEVVALLARNRESVYYIKQMQVLLEQDFFHWITGRAVGELIEERSVGHEDAILVGGKARFIFNKGHRYRARQIGRAVRTIERYSDTEIARACGHWAESLFLLALAEHGFSVHGRSVNQWGEKKWTATRHNLDFIVSRDAIAYGAEVKNTWDYIPPDELRTKLDMCEFLGLKPLMIWRFAPKTYMYEVIERGGYGMIFKTHIFPLGHSVLVSEIRDALGLECDTPSRIPDGILDRFVRWHVRAGKV